MTITKIDGNFAVSRIVYIRRRKVYNPRGQEESAAIKKLGAVSGTGSGPLSGLSIAEEEKYLPTILQVTPNSPSWSEVKRAYWNNISRPVEAGSGIRLETGFLYKTEEGAKENAMGDESKNKDDAGTPINVSDFVLWRFALKHPRVARSIEFVDKSPKIWFYLYSKEEELQESTKMLELKDKAAQLYVSCLGKIDLMRQVLWLTGQNPSNLDSNEVKIAFNTLSQDNPMLFISVVNDKDLEMKVFIEQAIKAEHLKRLPNSDTLYYGETNTVIANNINEAVVYLKSNSTQSKQLLNELKIKMKLQDVSAAPASIRTEKVAEKPIVPNSPLPDMTASTTDTVTGKEEKVTETVK